MAFSTHPRNFESFTKQWEFKHTTTSALYPQANRLVEKSVQTIKNLLTKAKQDNRDPYLGLLDYRNTPIDEVGSPAQLVMSRRLRSIFPSTEAQLQPRVLDPNKVKEKLKLKQEKQYFDQHTRQLPALEKGEQIRVRMGNRWEPGVVVDNAETPRSYKVQTDNGEEYRRNRKMLMKLLPGCGPASTDDSHFHDPPSGSVNGNSPCREQVSQANPVVEEPVSASQEQERNHSGDRSMDTSEQYKTRSGRVIRRQLQFKDCV